jgi:hypothetical protein
MLARYGYSAWGFGFYPMKNPDKIPARFNNRQAGLSGKFQWLAIPMTTEGLCKLVGVAILPAAYRLAIAPAVLQQQDLPIGAANSRHLFERGNGIGKRAGRERGNHGVETLVRKRQSLRVRHREGNMHG